MKRALVTGGSGDIGSAICHELSQQGLHIIVHGNRNLQRAESIAAEIISQGGSAEAIAFDITAVEKTQTALGKLLEKGAIQVLVNNAGYHDDAPMAGMTASQWQQVIDVCLNGFFNVTQPLLLPMMQTRWGRIINISSVAGMMGNRGQANYAAAKAGLHGATKTLALELASRAVTVNTVSPGIIAGQMTEDVFPLEMIKQTIPMKRAGQPQEVAALVAFLASENAGYISGQNISINGAMC